MNRLRRGPELGGRSILITGAAGSIGVACAKFFEALELLANGSIKYPQIATRFAMSDAPAVFARLADDPVGVHKAILSPMP